MPRELKQAFGAFGLAIGLMALLGLLARAVGFVRAEMGSLVAIVFLYLTVVVAKRRGENLVAFGFHLSPRLRSIAIAVTYVAVVLPVFTLGFVIFYDIACTSGSPLAPLASPSLCFEYQGWEGAHWPPLGLDTLLLAFGQVVVVALPEELFFRGLIHELCERALPPKRRVLKGGIGWALVISSTLFAIGHLAVDFDPKRLAVFFPGLVFGWMRSATGSILAGVIAHAASNLFIHILQRVFF